MRDISWPRTQQGQTAKQPCPVGTLGMEAGMIGLAKLLSNCVTLFLGSEKIEYERLNKAKVNNFELN